MSARWTWTTVAALAWACAPSTPGNGEPGTELSEAAGAIPTAPAAGARPTLDSLWLIQGDTVPGMPAWTRQDWQMLRYTVSWAWENGVDGLPVGERVARIGETFVGSPYLPGTLDPPGPERLVINLRAMDCVTYVENLLALADFVREAPRDILDRPEDAMRRYQELITRIRYRDGRLAGYPSRLHYFSEWLSDNEKKGFVDLITQELGGVEAPEPITWMTAHRPQDADDPYQPLFDQAVYEAIARTERELSATPRHYIPQERVAAVADRIQTGDVIAATSTLEGLDIAHTGIALWKDGKLHLMHAPLVGRSIEVSELPLPERLLGMRTQDGLMVARPLERQ